MFSNLDSAIIRNPVTASPETTVTETFRRMDALETKSCDLARKNAQLFWQSSSRVGCVVVIQQGHMVGIVTERDVVRLSVGRSPLESVTLADIMAPVVVTVRQNHLTDLIAVMDLFQGYGIDYLPIVDDQDQLVGLVSRDSLGHAALQMVATRSASQNPLTGSHSVGANPTLPQPTDQAHTDFNQELKARIEELEARANWERLLTDLTAQICSSLDIPTILNLTVQQVQRVLGCDRITIWQFETDGQAIAVAEATHLPVSLLGQRIHTADLNLGHNADSSSTNSSSTDSSSPDSSAPKSPSDNSVPVESYSSPLDMSPHIHATRLSDYHPDALIHLQGHDKILVPLFCGDNLWGLLQVNERCNAQDWHSRDVELLQFLSMQLAIALQHATTYQQLQSELNERRQAQARQRETAKALHQLNKTLETKVVERTLALQERESRYRALVEVMPDLMIRIHADGTYLDVVMGQDTKPYNSDHFRPGVKIYDVTPPDHAQTRMEYVHQALKTGVVQFYEYELTVNGTVIVEEARIVAINPEEALVIVRNITDRKHTENQLRESEHRFRTAIANAPFPIMIHAEDGEVLQINDTWTEFTGYAHTDIPTTQAWLERAYGDRAATIMATTVLPQYQLNTRQDEGEFTITTRDGQQRIWSFSSAPLGQLPDGRRLVISMAADVTQHRQAEMALQTSEARWQFALEGSGDGVWDWNAQTNTVFFSRQWKTMLGYAEDEIGNTLEEWDSRLHPDDKEQCYTDLNHHIQGETPVYQSEHRLRCKDGSYKWILDRGKVIEWSTDSTPLRVIGTHSDISDRKQAEAQLQNLLAGTAATTGTDFFPVLAQHLADALDVSYAVVSEWVDDQICSLAFWAKGQLKTGCSSHSHQTPCKQSLQEGIFYCASGVQHVFPHDPDLAAINAEAYMGIALYNSQGETIGNLCILHEEPIKAPKRAEQILRVFAARAAAELERQRARTALERLNQALETKVIERTAALQEREARYRGLMEGAGDGIMVCDRHGIILEVNRKAEEMLGYGRTELVGMDFKQLYASDHTAALTSTLEPMLSQPFFHVGDGAFQTKIGHIIPVDLSISNIDIQGEPIIQGIFRDISDRKQAEAILQQTNAELIRATRLKDEFLANMSHELRTPLNAILGMTEGLQDGVFGTLNLKQIDALQTVERSGFHLLQLINDILDVAKIESGHMVLDLAPTAIAPLCRSSLSFVKQQALKKHIQLETNLPSYLPDVQLDERRMRQVLINLLTNAVKFTPEGGRITLEASHQVLKTSSSVTHQGDTAPPQHCLRISVTDTGIGIAPEHINRLFQPFVQIDGALNRQYAGTGLGLALVKRIIELHKGAVLVSTEVGVGSCFTLTLPYGDWVPLPTAEDEGIVTLDEPDPTESLLPNILMVEDNDANVRTTSSYLKARGYRVLVAREGKEAITIIENQPPDLILMDIQMPGMDGLEAIQYIRSQLKLTHVPIIALTALAMEGDRDRCLAAGANEYLSKPVKLRLLASTIQQHLPKKNPRTDKSHE